MRLSLAVVQRFSLAVVRGNTVSILACVQVWSDFSHPRCISQCSCLSLAPLQWIAGAFRMSVFSVSFIVFSMFFYAFCKPPVQYCFAPSLAILTNLTLFFFMYDTTVSLFTVKPFCNLSLPLSVQHHLGCYVLGGTHTQWQYSIMCWNILLWQFWLFFRHLKHTQIHCVWSWRYQIHCVWSWLNFANEDWIKMAVHADCRRADD